MITPKQKVLRLFLFTVAMAAISFVLPLCWQKCTRMPTSEETASWTTEEIDLLDNLVRFQCAENEYNELASLYFVNANQCLQSLFHFREYEGADHPSFSVGPLMLFFVSYFLSAAMTAGLAIPVGLFIPSLVAGAAYGRIWGSLMNSAFSGYVADSGTYALMGAAAVNGGVTRMTLSMTIIMLETCGNMTYLLPLMVTFGAARYAGKFFAEGIYDIQLHMKGLPYLDSDLHSVGLLNLSPVTEVMSAPVITLCEVDSVRNVFNVLKHTKHNGFPTLDHYGRFRGLILRKTLISLLEVRCFAGPAPNPSTSVEGVEVAPCSAVFYASLEKKYPKYTTVDQLQLSDADLSMFIDLRPYMDTSAFIVHESTSVSRAHRQLRTMGLRHLVVVDSNFSVVGMVTRRDVTNKVLNAQWKSQGEHIKAYANVDSLPPAIAYVDEEAEGGQENTPNASGLDYGDSSSEESDEADDNRGIGMVDVAKSGESGSGTVLDDEDQY